VHFGYLFSEHSFFFLFHQGILIWHMPIFSAPNVQTAIMQVAQFDASSCTTTMMAPLSFEETEILSCNQFLIYFTENYFTLDSPVIGMLLLAFQ
jgi:hypothetical protein